ncbi:MAG: hypothetical protein P0Y52_09700 [Candidatus Brevundimonas phytovorans]|nr:hypothetical protein [Brevundimonas sp.]WEK56821.1 MAG: hypothetical protein P0Y52_09700 [Brevundimonas sp.]
MRTLTPLGWLALMGAAVLLLAIAGRGLGLRWDPFDLQQKRLDAAQAQASQAERDADARRIETAGQAQQAVRLEIHHRQNLAVERATVAAVTQARSAEDANQLLDPVRADRLHAHDRELCRLAPDLDGCAAPPGSG